MLGDILKIIKNNGYISRTQLARELNVEDAIIEAGIEELLRMGYLIEEDTGSGCSEFCSSCPFAKNCSKEIVKTFIISEEADKYLAKR